MNTAISIISDLLDKHEAKIEKCVDDGDFETDGDGLHITVCTLPAELHKIVSDSKNSSDWRDTLSNRIYESCAMEIGFGADDTTLIITFDPEDE